MSPTETLPTIQYKWKKLLIPFAISIVTIGGMIVAFRGNFDLRLLYSVSIGWFVLAFLKLPVVLPVQAYRWLIVLRARGLNVSFKDTFVGILIRVFFNNITPGVGTGGEPAAAYYLAKKSDISFKTALASSAAERIVQGLSVVVLAIGTFAFALPFLPLESTLVKGIIIGLVWFAVFVGVTFYLSIFKIDLAKKVIEWVVRAVTWFSSSWQEKWSIKKIRKEVDIFHEEYRASLAKPRVIISVVALTLVQAVLEVLQPYFIFKALGVDMPFWIVLVSILIIRVIGVFAILPGGSGLVEGANFGLYVALTNVPNALILAHTVLFRLLDAWIVWIVAGIVTAHVGAKIFYNNDTLESHG